MQAHPANPPPRKTRPQKWDWTAIPAFDLCHWPLFISDTKTHTLIGWAQDVELECHGRRQFSPKIDANAFNLSLLMEYFWSLITTELSKRDVQLTDHGLTTTLRSHK